MSLTISNVYYMKRFFARVVNRVGQAYIKLFPNTLKKRTWWPVFVVGVLLIAAMGVGIVHAQVSFSLEGLLNGLVELIAKILIELSKLCIFLTIFFLRAFITLASYNNFIDVSVVKLGWVMVRDVANMFFIVGLLVIAFATILGFESYEWKHGLVKIVLMAILINFSNLIAQLVIDVAHIFTITFLNAVSATAGGNLITLFQMDKILALASGAPSALGETRGVASFTLFAGSVLAFVFALLAALTIGAYLVVMVARIVMLWALIVLSPLAFMLYAVPKGEDYAHEWWSEFSKHVIVAPIMVFFLWLAFATLGTGQIITEITHGPGSENVIQLDSSGEEKQTVTVLEISTWENFASFLLAIGFLWVGIKKTEETGATGAGLVGNAIDFTKNVATIATGYAAGRWLVGGAVEKGKESVGAAGQEFRLGYNKILDKSGKFGDAVRAPGKYLKSRKISREKAIDKLDHIKHAEEEEMYDRAKHFLSPAYEKVARQDKRAELASKESETKFAKYLAEAGRDLAQDAKEKDRYEHMAEYEAKKEIAEKEEKAATGDLKVKAELDLREHYPDRYKGVAEKQTEIEGLEKGLKEIDRGTGIAARAEVFKNEKQVFNSRKEAELDQLLDARGLNRTALNGIAKVDERLERKEKELARNGGLSAAEVSNIESRSMKGLGEYTSRLSEMQNADREETVKQKIDEVFGSTNLAQLTRQRNEFEKESEAALIRAIQAKQAATPGMSYADAVSSMTDYERANVLDEVLENNPQWSKFQAMSATKSAERKIKKYKSETERLSLATSDILRGLEGKTMDQERTWEKSKIAEEMKEFQNMGYVELMDEMKRNYKTIKQLIVKETARTLSDQEEDVLKNARQRQASVIGSIHDQGMGGSFVHEFRDFAAKEGDASYADIPNDMESTHEIIMGALSGLAQTEIDTDEKFSQAQETFRIGLKEKKGVLMRTLMKGIQNSADLKGNAHHNSQLIEGVTEAGTKVVGFTNAMKAGVGDATIRLGTGTAQTGTVVQKGFVEGFSLPSFELNTATDGRAYVKTDASGKGVGFQHEQAKNALLSISRYTAQDIRKLGAPKLNYLSGGGYGASSWDQARGSFDMSASPEIQDTWHKIINNLFDTYHNSTGPTQDRALNAWREIYKQLGVEGADNMDNYELERIALKSGIL